MKADSFRISFSTSPNEINAINIKAHALGSAISITNFVIACHIRPLNLDM